MSTTIDERIVAMKFDNRNFEKNAAQSMDTIDLLKSKLNFDDVQKNLDTIDTSSIKREFENLGDVDANKLNTVLDKLEYRMSGFGIFMGGIVSNIANDVYSIVKHVTDGIDKVVNYAKDGIISGGIKRAMNLQSAKFQLEGLGIAWKDVSTDIDFAVKDTAYSLDKAANIASQLVTAGIMPGWQYKTIGGEERDIDTLAMILRSISGTAAMSGGKADYADIGNIFTKMLSYGKVYQTELNQIGTWAGINTKEVLASYFNQNSYKGKTDWTANDISEMMKDKNNALDPMILIEALYEKFGEHAVKANETLTGVMANTKSALSRIGANFFEPIIENGGPLVTLFEVLRRSINDVNKAIAPVTKLLAGDVITVLEKITSPFIEKKETTDENGETVITYEWKKTGGFFSSWLEPWHDPTEEALDFTGVEKDKIPIQFPESYTKTYESRISKFLKNMRSIFNSTGQIIYSFFSGISKGFKTTFPEFKGMADFLVKASGKVADVLDRVANSDFFNPEAEWKNSGWYSIVRGLLASIDIVIQFGKALFNHVLKPIFDAGAKATGALGIMDFLEKISFSIWEFDQRLKNGEDIFGIFFDSIKSKFSDLKDWFSHFSLKDTIQNIKDFFTMDFSLPGWERVISVFTKVGDAIGSAWSKIKEFFGFGKKNEETLGLLVGGSGRWLSGKTGMKGNLPGAALASTLETLGIVDEKTKNVESVGDRIKNFFGMLKESFSGFDFNGLSGVLTTFNLVLALAIGGTIYVIFQFFRIAKRVVIDLPLLANRIVASFESLIHGLTLTLQANRAEKYASSLKNISVSIAILVGTFTVLFGLIYLIEKFDKSGDAIAAMKKAGNVIGMMALILGGFLTIMMGLATKMASVVKVGSLKDLSSIQVSSMASVLDGLANILMTFIIGLVALSALVGLLALIPPEEFALGRDRLFLLMGTFAGVIVAVVGISELFSWLSTKGMFKSIKNVTSFNYVSSILGIGAIIAAMSGALLILTGAVWLLSRIDDKDFWNGAMKVAVLLGGFAIIVGALEALIALAGKIGTVNAGSMIAGMFSMSVLMGSIVLNVLLIIAAMKMVSGISNMWQYYGAIAAIAGLLTVTSMLLIVVQGILKKVTKLSASDILSMSVMLIAISASTLIIATAIRSLENMDFNQMVAAFIGIGSILIAVGVFTSILSSSKRDYKNVISSMLAISGVMIGLIGMSIAIRLFSNMDIGEYFQGLGLALLAIASVAGLTYLINIVAKRLDVTNLAKFAAGVTLLSISMLPIAIAIGALLYIHKSVGSSVYDVLGVAGALGIVILAIGAIATFLIKYTKDITVLSLVTAIATVSLLCISLIPVAAAMSLLFTAFKATGLSIGEAMGLMVGLGAAVALIGLGAAFIIGSSTEMATLSQAKMKETIRTILAIFACIGILMLSTGAMIGIMAKSGASAEQILATSAGFVVIEMLSIAAVKAMSSIATSTKGTWSDKRIDGVIKMMVALVGSMLILGLTIGTLSLLDQGKLGISAAIIAGIGGVLTLLTYVLQRIATSTKGTWSEKRLNKTMEMLLSLTLSMATLGVVAGVLATVCNPGKLAISAAVLVGLGAITIGLTALLSLVSKIQKGENLFGVLSTIGMLITITASMSTLAFVMLKLKDYDFEDLRNKMILFGAVVGVLTIIVGLVSGIGGPSVIYGMASFGSMLLGLAAAIASAGLLFFLAAAGLKLGAEGISILIDTFANAGDNSESVKKGMRTFGEGIGEAILGFLQSVNKYLPQINNEIVKLLQSVIRLVADAIKMVVAELANLLDDPKFISDLSRIFKGLCDIIVDVLISNFWYLGKRLTEEVIAPLGEKLGNDLWEMINGEKFDKAMKEADKAFVNATSEALEKQIATWDGYDAALAAEIMESEEMEKALEEYSALVWTVGTPTAEQRQEFYNKVKKIAEDYKETYNKATRAAFVKDEQKDDLGVQNGEYYQAHTSRQNTEKTAQQAYEQWQKDMLELYEKFPPELIEALKRGGVKIDSAEKIAWAWGIWEEVTNKYGYDSATGRVMLVHAFGGNMMDSLDAGLGDNRKSEALRRRARVSAFQPWWDSLISGGCFDVKVTGSGKMSELAKWVLQGFETGIKNKDNIGFITRAANYFYKTFYDEVNGKFIISSPSKAMAKTGKFVDQGFAGGVTDNLDMVKNSADILSETFLSSTSAMMSEAGKSDGEAYSEGFGNALSGIGDQIKDNFNSKVNWDELKSRVGIGKGIQENISGFKSIWSDLKNAFTNENGDFDLGFLVEGIDLQEKLTDMLGLGDITSKLGSSGLDLEGMDINNLDANMTLSTETIDMSKWKNEFEGFDVNDAISKDTLDLKLDIDTSAYDEFFKESSTGSLMAAIPATNGYAMSTTGSTYVNNYSYNQSITSTQPLSTREINRQTQRSLSRNRWNIGGGGGLRR